jgi:hypothetical protein
MNNRLTILAFAAALMSVVPLQAEQHPGNAKDRYYALGNRDGYQDFEKLHHKDHKHKFPNGDDRQAYYEGYEVGLLGGRTHQVASNRVGAPPAGLCHPPFNDQASEIKSGRH